jgi:hypothetical protein
MSQAADEQPSERSPLLGHQNGSANGQVVDPEGQHGADAQTDGTDEVVLAEEPSTRKLVLTMIAVWLGVFFAALGKQTSFSPRFSADTGQILASSPH